jgi:hypothetical protein
MSVPVQITINVTDGNTSEAVQQVVAQLNAIGPAGAAAGDEASAGMDRLREHTMGAREEARLMNEELHLGMSRAMLGVVADTNLLSGAIGALGPALIGIGAADIIFGIGEKVEHLYEKYVILDGVIKDSEAVVKGFGDSAALAMDRASAATEQYIRIAQGAQAADEYKLGRLQDTPIGIQTYQTDQFKNLPDAVKGDFEKITGESVMPKDLPEAIAKLQEYQGQLVGVLDKMERFHESSGMDALLGRNDPNGLAAPEMGGIDPSDQAYMEQQKKVEIGAHLVKSLLDQEAAFGAEVKASDAQVDKDKEDKAKKDEEREKAKQAEILSLQNSARDSELSGMALLDAQRDQALIGFVAKYGTSRRAIDAIDEEFNNKEIALWNQQWEEADKAMRTAQQAAQQAAHLGAGSIENDRQNTLLGIKGDIDPGAADEMRKAANLKANDDILAAQKHFDTEMQQIGIRSDDAQVAGYARIVDEAEKAKNKIQEDWQTLADKVGSNSTQAANAWGTALFEMGTIDENALRQMGQLHQKTMLEVSKEEEQAARLGLAEWQQSELAIIDAFMDRARAYKESEDQQLVAAGKNADARRLIEETHNQQVAAADAVMQAQLQKNSEETRDKIASGLQSMFSNPLQFFEKRAMDTAFQLMANEMLSTFKSSGPAGGILQYLFGMGPQMSTSTNPMTAMGSVLGMGHHDGAPGGIANPSMIQFQQGSTTLLTGSQALLQAAQAWLSASGSASFGGGAASGFGGFGLGGGTVGGAGASGAGVSAMPAFSTGSGMVGSSPMPETTGAIIPGSFDQSGQFNSAATGTAGLGAAGGIAGGGLMAATSIFSAYQNSNPIAGATGGAMGGMEMGAGLGSVIPGLGTVLGGAIGAIAGGLGGLFAGIFGDKGKGQAEGLDVNTVQPQLAKDMQEYESGQAGYSTIASDLTNLLTSSKNSTSQWGSGARNYFNSNIAPEINAAMSSLQKQEIGGRSAVTLNAGQYHTGGWTGDFGDLATSDTEGFIHAMRNEFVVNPMSAQAHAPLLNAINAGNVTYSNTVQPRMPSGSGGAPVINLSCWDAKSVAQWMKAGGARAIISGINQGQTQYSGAGR